MRYLVEKEIATNIELLKTKNIPNKYPKEFFTPQRYLYEEMK